MRCTTTPAGSAGYERVSASGRRSAKASRSAAIPSPRSPPAAEIGRTCRPSSRNAAVSSASRSFASGRSSLLRATSVVFSSSAGLCASNSVRMIAASRTGSAVEASTTCTSTRVREACRKKAKPRPAPIDAPSISPGRSAIVGRRPSSMPSSSTPRFGSRVVKA